IQASTPPAVPQPEDAVPPSGKLPPPVAHPVKPSGRETPPPSPVATRQTAPPPAPAPQASTPPPPKPAPVTTNPLYTVRVGPVSDRDRASAIAKQLAAGGFSPTIS